MLNKEREGESSLEEWMLSKPGAVFLRLYGCRNGVQMRRSGGYKGLESKVVGKASARYLGVNKCSS